MIDLARWSFAAMLLAVGLASNHLFSPREPASLRLWRMAGSQAIRQLV